MERAVEESNDGLEEGGRLVAGEGSGSCVVGGSQAPDDGQVSRRGDGVFGGGCAEGGSVGLVGLGSCDGGSGLRKGGGAEGGTGECAPLTRHGFLDARTTHTQKEKF